MQRKLTPLPVADLVGYCAMVATDEEPMVTRFHAVRCGLVDPEIELASYHALAGCLEEAAKALGKLLDVYPDLTVEPIRDSMPPSFVARNADHFNGLRQAGVPEE